MFNRLNIERVSKTFSELLTRTRQVYHPDNILERQEVDNNSCGWTEVDYEAILSDWQQIGEDFKTVIGL